jgi:histidinol-phosphate aminotransferase
LVVIDEAYADFAGTSFVDFIESYENLVIIRTFSKSLGLAGLRIGYALGEKNIISTIKTSMQHPFPVSSLATEIAIRLLKRDELVKKAIREAIRERKHLISRLNDLSTVQAFDSETNFVLFKTKQASRKITAALAQKGVEVRNIGRILGHRNCIRVTVGPRAIMDYFVSALKAVIS